MYQVITFGVPKRTHHNEILSLKCEICHYQFYIHNHFFSSNQDLCNDIGYTLSCLNLTQLNWSQGKLQGQESAHEGDGEPSQSV